MLEKQTKYVIIKRVQKRERKGGNDERKLGRVGIKDMNMAYRVLCNELMILFIID